MLPSPSAQAGFREVPFGDKVSEAIVNYNRTTPHVATAGLVLDGGIEELKALGFKAVLDLRTPPKGAADEDAAAGRAGLRYVNIPISKSPPTKEQIRTFAAVVDDPANYPLLVHCVSANRAGTMWTLYRVSKGIPFEIAIEEGRTVGMKPSREKQVRELLGKP